MPDAHGVIALLLTYKYVILFPLALVEGPLLAIAVGFLVRLGYFDPALSFIIMCAGDFFPDTLYYYIGAWGHAHGWINRLEKKFTSKSAFILKNKSALEKLWKNHTGKTMFFSKQAYGLSTVLLISAGLVRMPYRRFISYAFPITLLQYLVFMTVGYYLGYSYSIAGTYIEYAGYAVALFIIIFISGYVLLQKYARKKIIGMEKMSGHENGQE
jgi:membrane protein DedA with SNARE-associated domain